MALTGNDDAHRLLPDNASPHGFQLKPSDLVALQQADLVIWIGPSLEAFMQKPLGLLRQDQKVLRLDSLSGILLLPRRQNQHFATHDHGHDHGHDDHGITDPHLWLDPDNIKVMAKAITDELARINPEKAAFYHDNNHALHLRLDGLTSQINDILAPIQKAPFIVFHDGYQYFEKRFSLKAVGALTLNPETPPGVRQLRDIQQIIKTTGARCIFAEPQFSQKLVRVISDGSGAKIGLLDPLGRAQKLDAEQYPAMMLALAHSFRDCLGK